MPVKKQGSYHVCPKTMRIEKVRTHSMIDPQQKPHHIIASTTFFRAKAGIPIKKESKFDTQSESFSQKIQMMSRFWNETVQKIESNLLQGRVWQWILVVFLGWIVLMDLENFKPSLSMLESKITLATILSDTVASQYNDFNDSMVITAIKGTIYQSKCRKYAI